MNTLRHGNRILQRIANGQRPLFAAARLRVLYWLTPRARRHQFAETLQGFAMMTACPPRLPWHRRITLKLFGSRRRI